MSVPCARGQARTGYMGGVCNSYSLVACTRRAVTTITNVEARTVCKMPVIDSEDSERSVVEAERKPASITEDSVATTDVRVPSETNPSSFDALVMKAVSSIAESCICGVSCSGTDAMSAVMVALSSRKVEVMRSAVREVTLCARSKSVRRSLLAQVAALTSIKLSVAVHTAIWLSCWRCCQQMLRKRLRPCLYRG